MTNAPTVGLSLDADHLTVVYEPASDLARPLFVALRQGEEAVIAVARALLEYRPTSIERRLIVARLENVSRIAKAVAETVART